MRDCIQSSTLNARMEPTRLVLIAGISGPEHEPICTSGTGHLAQSSGRVFECPSVAVAGSIQDRRSSAIVSPFRHGDRCMRSAHPLANRAAVSSRTPTVARCIWNINVSSAVHQERFDVRSSDTACPDSDSKAPSMSAVAQLVSHLAEGRTPDVFCFGSCGIPIDQRQQRALDALYHFGNIVSTYRSSFRPG